MLDLAPATEPDAERLLALREGAAAWLQGRGIRQWEPGEVSVDQIRLQIDAGEWFVHRPDGEIQGALRLLWADPDFWGDQPDDAAYVHGLMIDRARAGDGLGARLLDWAEGQARGAERTFLRLDCSEANVQLRRYYRERGFREVGRRDLGGGWWSVTLLERSLAG